MDLDRRRFLTLTGATALAGILPGRLVPALEAATSPAPDLSSWAAVRAQFALAPDLLHFSNFFIASHPRPVREAIETFRRALDANPFLTVERGMFQSEAQNLQLAVARDAAEYLGGTPDEIALVPNTTTGLALVYHGLPLRAGDEVLTTTHDHYSHHESIRMAAERAGATVRRVPLHDRSADVTTAGAAERLRAAIAPATRVIGLTWVHSSTGVRLPIRALADVVAEANRGRDERDRIVLVVDGVHGLGAVEEPVASLGCDFFCSGTHKWIFAPRGTGLVWARAAQWARLRPTIPTFSSLEPFEAWAEERPMKGPFTAAMMSPGGFVAFEHQWAMGSAFRFHRQIGRARVAARIRELNDRLKDGLAAMPRVTLHTPRDPALSAGIVCFEVAGTTPEKVVEALLARKVVASTSPYRVTYARLSASLANDPAQVDSALRAVRAIAAT